MPILTVSIHRAGRFGMESGTTFAAGRAIAKISSSGVWANAKHTFAVELSAAIRDRVEHSRVIEPLDVQSCLFCYSKNIV
jgi:hypothetical protein